jgi:hypothetical protein
MQEENRSSHISNRQQHHGISKCEFNILMGDQRRIVTPQIVSLILMSFADCIHIGCEPSYASCIPRMVSLASCILLLFGEGISQG